MRTVLVAIVITLTCARARADTDDDSKSPLVAGLISAGGTVVAIWGGGAAGVGTHYTNSTAAKVGLDTTFAVSWLVLPSLGHYYAGDWISGGTIVRAIGLGLMGLDALSTNDQNENDAPLLPALGALTVLAGMAIDIATAPGAARDYNSHQHRVSISPTVLTPPSGPVVGLGVGGEF